MGALTAEEKLKSLEDELRRLREEFSRFKSETEYIITVLRKAVGV